MDTNDEFTRWIEDRPLKRVGIRYVYDSKPGYSSWTGMKSRCHNPHSHNYAAYGARGIRVCDRWRNSFEAFIEDVGPKPGPEYSIDRIDVNGNYEPGNCRWATREQQNGNRRPVTHKKAA